VKRPLFTAIVVGALAYASVASAAATQIKVDDDFYAPDNPPVRNLSSGASFTWTRAANSVGPHNVRQDFGIFNSGSLTSGPINFSIRASAGTYHYYCIAHGSPSGGMDGVVRVRPISAADPAGAPFTVRWALPVTTPGTGTNTGNQFDVRFRVGVTGTWRLWGNDVSVRSGVFGQNGRPLQVMPDRTYQFQARSQKSSAPTQPSGWSPTLTVNT
jgi:plastocyanin